MAAACALNYLEIPYGLNMCGIAGYLNSSMHRRAPDLIEGMTEAIKHRGPDSGGTWSDLEIGIAIGMRRLAILDLSPAGEQPMLSQDGRYVLVFNGEIYNHEELRGELEMSSHRPKWRGHSDTEALLEAICAWGLERALKSANGMFALALWDRQERALHLAIDRFGEKPLYYGWMSNNFVFGSELKALKTHPSWRAEVDQEALSLYLRFGYVPAPHCIFRGLKKMRPGEIATLRSGAVQEGLRELDVRTYWSAFELVSSAMQSSASLAEADAEFQFEALFTKAVCLRMEADVPLGAFLSGGVDSSAVVSIMQRASSMPVRTFAIGFSEPRYNEAPFAKRVAQYLGTDHTELYVTPREAMDVIPRLSSIYDEPFADVSQIPTYLVAELARQQVTVALSGDGGDEMLGGYRRHIIANSSLPIVSRLPSWMRRKFASVIASLPSDRYDAIYRRARFGKPGAHFGDGVLKFADFIALESLLDGYKSIVSYWQDPGALLSDVIEPRTLIDERDTLPDGLSLVEQMMFLDLISYLPGDVLTKLDRATMAVGLESRVPFLDPKLMEFVWSLPLAYKVKGGVGKRLLRSLVYRHIPREIMDRPKSGFSVPIKEWLRGPLKPWAEALLKEQHLEDLGFIAEPVRKIWAEHLNGVRNSQDVIWPILQYIAWARAFNSGNL